MSIPAIETIRQNFETSEIYLIGRIPAIEIFRNYRGIKKIIELNNKLIPEIKAHFELKKEKIDKAYLLPNSFGSAFSMVFSGSNEIIGYLNEGRGIFLTKRFKKKFNPNEHFSNYYKNLVISSGLENMEIDKISLSTSKDEKKWAENFLSEKLKDINIGISPGAAYGNSKKWFTERFKEVAIYFERQYQARTFVFGSKSDNYDCEKVVTENSINLCGKTSIREAMALIERMDIFISNDSGLMHLANALGVPVIGIFGPTIPTSTYPFNKNHKVLFHKAPCSPCKYRECPLEKKICMDMIKSKEVINSVKSLLNLT